MNRNLLQSPAPVAASGRLVRVMALTLVLVLSASACATTGTVELVAAATPVPTVVDEQPTPVASTPVPTVEGEQPTPVPPTPVPPTVEGEQPTPMPPTPVPPTPVPPTPVPPTPVPPTPVPPTPVPPTPVPPTPVPPTPVPPTPVPPTPVPELQRLDLHPDGGIDGFAGTSQKNSLVRLSGADWKYNTTTYRAMTGTVGGAINEDFSAWAGGRRRFTPPQPEGLYLNLDMTLKGGLYTAAVVGADVEVMVIARIQTTEHFNGRPRIEKKITVYSVALSTLLEGFAGWENVDERLRVINEGLGPLEMGRNYHLEVELRCRSQVFGTFLGAGTCDFGGDYRNEALRKQLPDVDRNNFGLVLHDASLTWLPE